MNLKYFSKKASHGGYIFSYAVETYDLASKHSGAFKDGTHNNKMMSRHPHSQNNEAYITALFWAFFSIGRLASVFIATKLSAPFMLLIDIVRYFLSNVITRGEQASYNYRFNARLVALFQHF